MMENTLASIRQGRIQNFRMGGPDARGSISTERRVGTLGPSLVLSNCILIIAYTYSRHFRSIHELIFKQVLA